MEASKLWVAEVAERGTGVVIGDVCAGGVYAGAEERFVFVVRVRVCGVRSETRGFVDLWWGDEWSLQGSGGEWGVALNGDREGEP